MHPEIWEIREFPEGKTHRKEHTLRRATCTPVRAATKDKHSYALLRLQGLDIPKKITCFSKP